MLFPATAFQTFFILLLFASAVCAEQESAARYHRQHTVVTQGAFAQAGRTSMMRTLLVGFTPRL